MKLNYSPSSLLLAGAIVMGSAMVIAGCQNSSHPDEKSAVTNSLNSNNLSSIDVSQDRDKGVMTLKGNVASDNDRQQAEAIARQSAPDYTIANEIGVRPARTPRMLARSLPTWTPPSKTISKPVLKQTKT